MENDHVSPEVKTPPDGVDIDEGLDSYDRELTETFPASDTPTAQQPV